MPQNEIETRRRTVQQSWDAIMNTPEAQAELEAGRAELEWYIAHPSGGQ